MFSHKLVLLQLLWLPLVSTSHFYGSVMTFTAKKDRNGHFGVEIRNKATYDGCNFNYGPCYNGNCGVNNKIERGQIDSSDNSPVYNKRWCQTETIVTKTLTSDRPFQIRDYSCCWIRLSSGHTPSWSALASVDFGRRSDTNTPNSSPAVAILPFLRSPQNCRRKYKPMSFDPDGDRVRCRYGVTKYKECSDCRQHHGFKLDQDCTLHNLAMGSTGVYGFELVVEDFPQNSINLIYSDGSSSYRYGLYARKKRAITVPWSTITRSTTTTTFVPPITNTPLANVTLDPMTPTNDKGYSPYMYDAQNTTDFSSYTATESSDNRTPPTITSAPFITDGVLHKSTTNTNANAAGNFITPAPHITSATTTTATITTAPSTAIARASIAPATRAIYASRPNTTSLPFTLETEHYETPLSQIPLQFTFQVDPPAPSCIEGEYLPKLVPPTPRSGDIIVVEAGREVELRVRAKARYSVLVDMIMSGPLNITKHRTTRDEFAIRWTPIEENLGQYFPICFAVEFRNGSAIYQTEMRCVAVNVTGALVKTVVTCLESSMVVEVEKATLPRLRYDHLTLSDSSNTVCSLQTHSNRTHVVAVVPLNACGTQIEEDSDDLLFKNEITTVDNVSSIITRRNQVEIKFFCQYAKRGNITFTFSAHRNKVTVWDKGLGQFTYSFEFFPDQRFLTMIDPRMYPLEYFVGDRLYMKIEATSNVNNTQLFVDSCRATPYDTPHYQPSYSIIENGCNLDSTLIVYPTTSKTEFKLSIAAFKFIGLHDQVYISCSVLMCEAGNPHTRCSRGCQTNPNPLSRSKRAAAIESGSHYVSQGPLRLRRSAEAAGSTGLNLDLNLVFIGGCALAAVGMICGVIFYRTKKSSFKYQRLSTEEN